MVLENVVVAYTLLVLVENLLLDEFVAPPSRALDRLDGANAQVIAKLNHFWYTEA